MVDSKPGGNRPSICRPPQLSTWWSHGGFLARLLSSMDTALPGRKACGWRGTRGGGGGDSLCSSTAAQGALAVSATTSSFPTPQTGSSGPRGENVWSSLLNLEFNASAAGTELKKHAHRSYCSWAHWFGQLFARLWDQKKQKQKETQKPTWKIYKSNTSKNYNNSWIKIASGGTL